MSNTRPVVAALEEIAVPEIAFAITPSDTEPLDPPIRVIYVGTGGDLTVIPAGQEVAVTYKNLPSGSEKRLAVKQVMATGTDAEDLVGEV